MPIQIAARDQQGIQILDLKGSLIFGQEDLKLRDELDRMIGAGQTRIILNLKNVHKLDTTGLGTLTYYALVKVPMEQGKLVLCELTELHMETLRLKTSEALLPVFSTEEDAIDSFFPRRHAPAHYLLNFARSEELRNPGCRDLADVLDEDS